MKKLYTNSILGIPVAVTRMEEAVSYILEHLEELRGQYICLTNVHATMTAYQDPEYLKAQNEAAICLPDGSPLAYILRRRHFAEAERVAGPDLMPSGRLPRGRASPISSTAPLRKPYPR